MEPRPVNAPESESPTSCPNRRRLVPWLGAIGLLFCGIFALIVYTDAEPPDVDDLRDPPLQPAGDTYYDRFLRFAAEKGCEKVVPYAEPEDLPENSPFRMPDGGADSFLGGFSDFLSAGKGWSPERLATWSPQLDLFVENCAKLTDANAFPATLNDPAPSTTGSPGTLVAAARENLEIAVGMYWAIGDKNRALETAFQLEDFGRRLMDSAPGPEAYVAAANAVTTAERGIVRLSFQDTAVARAALDRFCHPPPEDPARFSRIIHAAYFDFERLIDEQSVAANAARDYQTPVLFKTLAQTRVLYPWVMKPNMTKDFYADYVRKQLPLIGLNTAEYRSRPEGEELRLEIRDLTRPTNLYGRLLGYQATWRVQNLLYLHTRANTQRSLFRACLALRIYHDEHGSLPDKLAELVPRYLPDIPIDHANGQALRYAREVLHVWSAGLDNLQIGHADPRIRYREDCYRLDFAAPAP